MKYDVFATPSWLDEIRGNARRCEALRRFMRKPEKTGTISERAALYLREIVEVVQPKVCIEIGTFIGTSALVLASKGAYVFTCDKDNDAFKSQDRIVSYGKYTSTAMLESLAGGTVADLWFFDGRIQPADLALIATLSHPTTVYAFDDYEGREKGVVNVGRLRPQLPSNYELIPPTMEGIVDAAGRTTIAVLAPKGRL